MHGGGYTIHRDLLALRAGQYRQRLPGWRDLAAVVLVVGVVVLLGSGARQMIEPAAHAPRRSWRVSPSPGATLLAT